MWMLAGSLPRRGSTRPACGWWQGVYLDVVGLVWRVDGGSEGAIVEMSGHVRRALTVHAALQELVAVCINTMPSHALPKPNKYIFINFQKN